MHLDPASILQATGYVGLFMIVFVESGLLVGFFLPGDSLLFAAGFLASQGLLDISAVIGLVVVAAILGDSVGYSLGRRFGPRVFKRKDARIFNQEHLVKSERFYAKHGGKTLVLARFMPIVRTFAPVLAGVGKMPYSRFLSYNVFGGLLWGLSLPLLGFYLGKTIPNIDRYLIPIVILIILLSISPSIWHLLRHPRELARLKTWLGRWLLGRREIPRQ